MCEHIHCPLCGDEVTEENQVFRENPWCTDSYEAELQRLNRDDAAGTVHSPLGPMRASLRMPRYMLEPDQWAESGYLLPQCGACGLALRTYARRDGHWKNTDADVVCPDAPEGHTHHLPSWPNGVGSATLLAD